MATEHDELTGTVTRTTRGQVYAFALRALREIRRDKFALFWAIGFPTAFFVLTITIFVDLSQYDESIRAAALGGFALTFGMFGALFTCLTVFGRQLATDVANGRYKQFRAMSISPAADMLGRMLAGGLVSLVAFAIVLVVALPFGASYALQGPASPLILAAIFLVFCVFWMVVALGIVSLSGDARNANIITISVAMAAFYLTGFNGTAPESFVLDAELLNVLPNTVATRLVVYHGADFADQFPTPPAVPGTFEFLLTLGYGVVAVVAGVWMARRFYSGGET